MIEKTAIGTIARAWNPILSEQFADSLMRLGMYSQHALCGPNEFIHYVKGTVSYHELMRGELVDKSLGEWVLQLDTDHAFSSDLLERLLYLRAKYNTQVLSGIYAFKNPPHGPVACTIVEGKAVPLASWDYSKEIIPVDYVGGGCLLVNRDVFKQIEDHFKVPPFTQIQGLSEDYSFCARCKELGIQVHLATNVQSHHFLPGHQLLSIEPQRCRTQFIEEPDTLVR